MSSAAVRILLWNELRMLLRDRRTVVLSVALPLLAMPLMLYSIKFITAKRRQNLEAITYRYVVTGSEAARARAVIEAGRREVERERAGDEKNALLRFTAKEVEASEPAASLKQRKIHFYVEALAGPEADASTRDERNRDERKKKETEEPEDSPSQAKEKRLEGVPLLRVVFQGDWDPSSTGGRRMAQILRLGRRAEQVRLLEARGFGAAPSAVVPVDSTNLASPAEATGAQIGRFLTVFLVMLILGGASVVALDSIAGEKERGSLETLLTTAVRRVEIVTAKQLAILIVALTIALLQVGNMLVYLNLRILELPSDFVISAPPVKLLTLLALFVPVAVLLSAVLLGISAYAKSYKEAQLYFFPLHLLALLPALASALPAVSLRSAIVVVPLANVSVAVREVMVDRYDWPMLALTFIVMCAAAAGVARSSARMLSRERLITSADTEAAELTGGPALFERRVLRLYLGGLAIMFAAAVNLPQLAALKRQLFFTEVVVCLGGSFFLIRHYRLNLREALALRSVRWPVWLAVALLIPSANLVGVGVFRLANLVLPVPKEALEQFAKTLLPKDVPFWQILILLSPVPGFCEEIAFRGPLVYGLRRRLRPVALVAVVGLVFGLFHVALFRIIPTGFLGMVLTALLLLTGSIFPCMLLHAGNNAFGVIMGYKELPLGTPPIHVHLAAAAVFALAFYVLWRNRTPYPGLVASGERRPGA